MHVTKTRRYGDTAAIVHDRATPPSRRGSHYFKLMINYMCNYNSNNGNSNSDNEVVRRAASTDVACNDCKLSFAGEDTVLGKKERTAVCTKDDTHAKYDSHTRTTVRAFIPEEYFLPPRYLVYRYISGR